jgi:polyhydroxybutyrate depolymerase
MKKNILTGIFCSLVLLFNTLKAQQTLNKTIDVNGVKRSYILYLPKVYTGAQKVPLLFCFHGYNMQASAQMAYGDFRKVADTANFILVYPQGSLMNNITHWNVGGWTLGSTANDIGFTRAMIDTLKTFYQIDTTRIYSTGFSNGGFFSFELACQMGEKIAAIGSVCGSMTPETYANCNPNHPMPTIQIHGTADPVIRYMGESFSLPIDSTLAYWNNINQTSRSVIIDSLPDTNLADACKVKTILNDSGLFCNALLHYKIINGKHTWPGTAGSAGAGTNQDFNASQAIWNFVSQYSIHGKIGCQTLGNKALIKNKTVLSAYPNPSNGNIEIKGLKADIQSYRIMNSMGQIISQGEIGQQTNTINVSNLVANVYFLQIGIQTLKIIKVDY